MAACCFYFSDTGGRVGGTATLGVKGGGREEGKKRGSCLRMCSGLSGKPVPRSVDSRRFQSAEDGGANSFTFIRHVHVYSRIYRVRTHAGHLHKLSSRVKLHLVVRKSTLKPLSASLLAPSVK